MSLLISNDDGINAEGIQVLSEVLSSKFEVKVVAPDRDHSGASSSLTLSRPLRVMETANGHYCIDGTPTDSVHLGVSSLFDLDFERVVSGINSHENLGDDVLYSGTVAAAIEGRFLKQPAIAVSLVNQGQFHYQTAAKVVLDLLVRSKDLEVPERTILNVNVPDVPYEQLKGIKVTRLGHRAKGLPPEEVSDPRGRQRYWISLAGEGDDAGEGTDFDAVKNGYVSVTPLQVDMTRHELISQVKDCLED
ncbi:MULTISPECIES: 5'/3'-nucleotidase SurE [unclassified Oleiphilus]|jgi:5'-nucleotidase|uniref:5'/3'-nucleotidase SurE n=1 Tax=unclassified Oleiphilus TaxID=2631174 RepID=UPI0007C34942|nr:MULTISPECIES: 5'/3'-nucleotidase SurE [unclassified Oleiphilus]KZY44762.1 5'/3'-nucleotidase SurE [Oleiphilus sp. HI0050]KZY76732.1 5'/3'-nucleotidase SurE [Oleiphilus sp. HI0068]KZY78141.1 5'/3'-nucleotidase SurE [Oleiphilus sp. HI0069]KZY85742.1 5'/3'-nucleotidase SurE [Oleiphilus sp. HI0072]KZZ33497.1 5'/3'-nucleotidase SurE [Oleiphilus sp. HI0085]